MIRFENVSFCYPGQAASLENVSLHIREGEFAALIGSNGAGKSTTARLVNGLLKPTSGRVMTAGLDTRSTRTSTLARTVGFLFQNPDRQICQNTVRDELAFGLKLQGISLEEIEARCRSMLETFALPAEAAPFSLSRGQRQQLALASLLVLQPGILILDEPTTGLDYRECTQIMEIVREQNRQGATVIMISHDMEIVQDYSDHVFVLNHGHLLDEGPTCQILADRALLEQASLLPPQIADLALRLGSRFDGSFTIEDMVSRIEGGGRA